MKNFHQFQEDIRNRDVSARGGFDPRVDMRGDIKYQPLGTKKEPRWSVPSRDPMLGADKIEKTRDTILRKQWANKPAKDTQTSQQQSVQQPEDNKKREDKPKPEEKPTTPINLKVEPFGSKTSDTDKKDTPQADNPSYDPLAPLRKNTDPKFPFPRLRDIRNTWG